MENKNKSLNSKTIKKKNNILRNCIEDSDLNNILDLISTNNKNIDQLQKDAKSFKVLIFKLSREMNHNIKKVIHSKYFMNFEFTLLSLAILHKNHMAARFLISLCKTSVHQTVNYTYNNQVMKEVSPIYMAVCEQNYHLCELLLHYKANPNKKNSIGDSPISLACALGLEEILYLLIRYGGNVNTKDKNSYTALMTACNKNHMGTVFVLLESKAMVNEISYPLGTTALHEAIRSGNKELVSILLKYGAKRRYKGLELPAITAASLGDHHISAMLLLTENNKEPVYYQEEIINVLELLGAMSIVLTNQTSSAFSLWNQALEARYEDKNYEKQIELEKDTSKVQPINGITEFKTKSELDNIKNNPEKALIMAALIPLRILGRNHSASWQSLMSTGCYSIASGDNDVGTLLWRIALIDRCNSNRLADGHLITSISYLIGFFADNLLHKKDSTFKTDWEFANIVFLLEMIQNETQKTIASRWLADTNAKATALYDHVKALMDKHFHIMCIFLETMKHLQPQEIISFKRKLYNFLKTNPRNFNGRTLLHLVCSAQKDYLTRFYPTIKIIDLAKLLTDCGCNLHAKSSDGRTALFEHTYHSVWAAINKYGNTKKEKAITFRETELMAHLFEKGATIHSCMASENHLSNLLSSYNVIIKSKRLKTKNSLKCLATKAVLENNLDYSKDLPQDLLPFIELHKNPNS